MYRISLTEIITYEKKLKQYIFFKGAAALRKQSSELFLAKDCENRDVFTVKRKSVRIFTIASDEKNADSVILKVASK